MTTFTDRWSGEAEGGSSSVLLVAGRVMDELPVELLGLVATMSKDMIMYRHRRRVRTLENDNTI